MHWDFVYSVADGYFSTESNSLVENNSAMIGLLGDNRTLLRKKISVQQYGGGRNVWVSDAQFKASFTVDIDSVCVINCLDENQLGFTNIDKRSQY